LCFHNVRASGLSARRYVEEIEGEGNGEDEVWECYEPDVLTHWMICLICLAYAPADDNRSREILGDRIVECVNGKLVFRKIERATPQHSISECTGMNVEIQARMSVGNHSYEMNMNQSYT